MAISKPFYVSGSILLYVYCMLYDNVTYRKDKRTCFAVGQIQEITFENHRCLGFTSILPPELFVNPHSPDRPDPPTQIQMTEPKDRSVTLSWTPGDDHNSPVLGTVYVLPVKATV